MLEKVISLDLEIKYFFECILLYLVVLLFYFRRLPLFSYTILISSKLMNKKRYNKGKS